MGQVEDMHKALHTHTMCSIATMSGHFAICMHIIRECVCLESFANFLLCWENISNFYWIISKIQKI